MCGFIWSEAWQKDFIVEDVLDGVFYRKEKESVGEGSWRMGEGILGHITFELSKKYLNRMAL